jgi:hypothetical protein
MLEMLAACGGMRKALAPNELTSIRSKGKFFTTVEFLPVYLLASPGWPM